MCNSKRYKQPGKVAIAPAYRLETAQNIDKLGKRSPETWFRFEKG